VLNFVVSAAGSEPSPEACNVHQDLWTVDVVVPSYGCHLHSLPSAADGNSNMGGPHFWPGQGTPHPVLPHHIPAQHLAITS